MSITVSELFLLVWAVGASILAGWSIHKARNMSEAISAMMFAFKEIAQGKAEVSFKGDSLTIRKTKE